MKQFFIVSMLLCLAAALIAPATGMAQQDFAEAQVLAAEKARTAALINHDLAALDKLLADDLTYVHASGRVDTKASLLEAIRSDKLHYMSWEPKDLHVRMLGDIAVLDGKYHVHVINRFASPDPLDIDLLILSVYARRGGHWQQIAWESTKDVGPQVNH